MTFLPPSPLDDPAEYFADLAAANPRCFWLDGGGAREWSGLRSLVGWLDEDDVSLTFHAADRRVVRHQGGRASVVGDDIFDVLEELMEPGEQWFGYFGYGCRTDLPAQLGGELPDAVWMRARHVRLFAHEPVIEPEPRDDRPTIDDRRAIPPAYAAAFDEVQEALHAGHSYEVNLTYRVDCVSVLSPAEAYLRLRHLNPAPYAGFLQHDVPGHRAWLLSSSPERYALVTDERVLETKPIKGTTPRGLTLDEDAVLRFRLMTEPKFRSENLMITDLLRNDLSMVCRPGTVEVPDLMEVESYANVHQLVSTVRGRLADDVTTVGALKALFPAGSMTGAPKLRTMEVIEDVEGTPRGAYAGAFGWISGDGQADLGVVIRTLTTTGNGTFTLGTGGGITVGSSLGEEYAESRWKADRLLRVFGQDTPE